VAASNPPPTPKAADARTPGLRTDAGLRDEL